MKRLRVNELNVFSGGMNTVEAPYLIDSSESTLLINADIRRGAIWSMPERMKKLDLSYLYWFQFKGDIYQYGTWRSNVVWDNTWYWADGAFTGKVLPDGTELPLGLPTPTVRPTLTSTGVDTGIHEGEFRYCYTFLDSTTGTESAPSPLSAYISVTKEDIVIDNFETLPPSVDTYRIYRIGGYLPYFMLVEEIKAADLPYIDSLDESQIRGTILGTLRNGPPPSGINYLTEMNGRVYAAEGNKLYYSAVGNPDSWYNYDFISVKDEVLGLAKAPGGLLVFGNTWTLLLRGDDPHNFQLQVLSDKVGLIKAESINYVGSSVIWLSNHGVVISDGYTINQLTSDKIEEVSGIVPTGSQVLNNVYYMSFKPELYPAEDLYPSESLYPNGVKGVAGVTQGILAMDFKRGKGYSYKIINHPDIEYLDVVDGVIGITNGQWNKPAYNCDITAYSDCLDFTLCSGLELAYLTSPTYSNDILLDELSEIEYISPLLIDGTNSTMKEYERIRLLFKGVFKLEVYFDNNRKVAEKWFISTPENKYQYSELGIPNDDDKAYSIRFKLTGRGVLKGLQYTYKYREHD